MVNQFSINMLPRKHALLPEAPSQRSGLPQDFVPLALGGASKS